MRIRPVLQPVLVFRLLLGLFVVLGIQPLLRLPQEIGQLYLGVPLSPSLSGKLFVNIETSSHWPGIGAGLRSGDRILRIEGRNAIHAPGVIAEVAENHREGDIVRVDVQRDSQQLTVHVPLQRYRLAEALELHGLWFLAGLNTALAAWLLFRPPNELMALALVPLIGLLFAHGNTGYADPRFGSYDFYPLEPMWTYGYYTMGAVLVHLAWRFPLSQRTSPRRWSARSISPSIVGLYSFAFTFGTAQELTRAMKWIPANEFLNEASLVVAGAGSVVALLRLAWVGMRSRADQGHVRILTAIWSGAIVLILGVGIVPFWSSDIAMLLAQFLFSIAVIYPLLLVYAVRQVELVDKLEREAEEKRRWADLARELQRFREEDLLRVTNALHDTVLADLKAVEMKIKRLLPDGQTATRKTRRQDPDRSVSEMDLQTLQQTIHHIQAAARQVTKGVMPLDFAETGIREALRDAMERFKHLAPNIEARLEVEQLDDEPPVAVREAMYWIAASALNNCREHARASQVTVFVSVQGRRVQMTVQDDGIGFDVRTTLSASLGIRNMHARAEQVGGQLQIESDARGTTVHFNLTLPPREQPIRVLVVEDSEMFASALHTGLKPWADEIQIVGTARSAHEARRLARTLEPDIALVDLRIPESAETDEPSPNQGLWLIPTLEDVPKVRTVLMSFYRDPAWLQAAAGLGAWAFWHKDDDPSALVNLARRVAAGDRLLTEEQWVDERRERLVEDLSPREWEVLLYLNQGFSNQDIAEELVISVRTVEKHVHSVMGKLGASSRGQAVARARDLRLLPSVRSDFPPPESATAENEE